MAPVLQHHFSGTGLPSPEGERNSPADANSIWRIMRFAFKKFDEFLIVAINRPAVARSCVLSQGYLDRVAQAHIFHSIIIRVSQRQHRARSLLGVDIENCAGGIHEPCTHQRRHAIRTEIYSGHWLSTRHTNLVQSVTP